MKRFSSNNNNSSADKWNERLSYALTILILIDCLVPFAWNNRPQNHRTRRSVGGGKFLFEALEKAATFHQEFLGDFGIGAGSTKQKKMGKGVFPDSGGGLYDDYANAIIGRHNLTVFILPDLVRRTTTGNENLATAIAAANQELSLQDSDAIDFYWRQDIDAEKGAYPTLWSPDLQYERDVQLITEKTLLQTGYPDSGLRGGGGGFSSTSDRREEAFRDFLASQQQQYHQLQKDAYFSTTTTTGSSTLDTPTAEEAQVPVEDKENTNFWHLEEKPFLFEFEPPTTSDFSANQQQENQSGAAAAAAAGNENFTLDWLNSTNTDPLNDIFLHASDHHRHQAEPTSEHAATGDDELNTPPTSMEWELSSAGYKSNHYNHHHHHHDPVAQNNLDEANNRADPMLGAAMDASSASASLDELLDNLPTPDLQLAPNDVARIFGNDQVARDVAEAHTTKESTLRRSSPFFLTAAADAGASTSDADVMMQHYVQTAGAEPMVIGSEEQSQVIIDTFPDYDFDQHHHHNYPPSTLSWIQSSPLSTSTNNNVWHPQIPTDGLAGMTISPTWNGDHDYVSPESSVVSPSSISIGGDRGAAQQSIGGGIGVVVKSEPISTAADGDSTAICKKEQGSDEEIDDDQDDEDDEDNDPMTTSSEERARMAAASERDEARARRLNLPFSAAEIVTMSQDTYVAVTRSKLSRDQIELIKEIRRHGGNKEAARRSRQRKVQMSKRLQEECQRLEQERNSAAVEYQKLLREVETEEMVVQDLKRKIRRK